MKKPGKLSAKLFNCISRGAKTHGTYDPDEILYLFEEELTLNECNLVVDFLNWLHTNGKGVGSGNRVARYQEYIDETGDDIAAETIPDLNSIEKCTFNELFREV